MSSSQHFQLLIAGAVLGMALGLLLPHAWRVLGRVVGRLLPSRHFKAHPRRRRAEPPKRTSS
ncbi:hypothetical protein [Azotobacter armeniacus]